MSKNILVILIMLLFSSIILLIDDYFLLGRIYFYVIIFYIGISLIKNKAVQLIDVWNAAFVFTILSEILLLEEVEVNTLYAIKYLLIANNLINIGYLSKNKTKISIKHISLIKVRNTKIITPILLGVIIFFVSFNIQYAILAFSKGRNVLIAESEGENFVLHSIIASLGFITPAIVAYYFTYIKKNKLWVSAVYSMPVFIVLFMEGSRFPLLFSFLGFLIVIQAKYFKKLTLKQYFFGAVLLLGLFFISTLMKNIRSSTGRNTEFILVENNTNSDMPKFLASNFMSAEGIVDMTSLMFKYFETNPHLYGSSSSFILYFWIPREVWPDKPTMLGHWFIRQYRSGFAEGHSSSFGFAGDLYVDFGLFSLFFVFLIGRLLKTAENFKNRVLQGGGYNVVIGTMLFPYVFFFVRSPITATMTFLGMLFFYYIFKHLIFSK